MTKHCMIDLETLDTIASAKILSIGAVVFDENGTIFSTFGRNITTNGQEDRTMSHDTLMWWFKQSEQARGALAGDAMAHGLASTLAALNTQLAGHKGIKLWSLGANFDLPIISHAMRGVGIAPSWNFWNERCFRTLRAMHGNVPEPERKGAHHNALDDAKHQAQHLIAIHRAVGGIL